MISVGLNGNQAAFGGGFYLSDNEEQGRMSYTIVDMEASWNTASSAGNSQSCQP